MRKLSGSVRAETQQQQRQASKQAGTARLKENFEAVQRDGGNTEAEQEDS
jgi:hypothetical protein